MKRIELISLKGETNRSLLQELSHSDMNNIRGGTKDLEKKDPENDWD